MAVAREVPEGRFQSPNSRWNKGQAAYKPTGRTEFEIDVDLL